jgi:hypothetical protein
MHLSEFQLRTKLWMNKLPEEHMLWDDVQERAMRLLEEAHELVQSLGVSRERAAAVADDVYGRPVGDPEQEFGGVSVTLAVLANVTGISWERSAVRELERINKPHIIEKIIGRQSEKRAAGMTSR